MLATKNNVNFVVHIEILFSTHVLMTKRCGALAQGSSLVEAGFPDQGDRGATGEPQQRQDRQPVRVPSHVLSQNFTVADSDTRRASPTATFRLL
jgi:hypothetical protein